MYKGFEFIVSFLNNQSNSEGAKSMKMKSFEHFQQEAGIEVEEKVNLDTKEAMYEYTDETLSSRDIWQSQHLGARLRCARQLNWIMRPSKE